MIRVIAFVIALACGVGLISGVHGALTGAADDLVFTEVVKYGDPSVLDGRVIRAGIECGDHMTWNTTYTFGEENCYDTEFIFTQKDKVYSYQTDRASLEIYDTSGFGISSSGTLTINDTPYSAMIRAVAAITPDGGEKEMNLKLSDYVDYHALDLDLDYISDSKYCQEYVSSSDLFFDRLDEGLSFEEYVLNHCSLCYLDLCELFKFPVQDDEVVSINVEKNATGGIGSVGYNAINGPVIRIITTVNDNGAYLIPVYLKSENSTQALQGEYAQGMGIYFIPWKIVPSKYSNVASGATTKQYQTVTLDVVNAKNVYPLPETAVVYGLEVDGEGQTAWMLSMEGGMYVLTHLDLTNGEVLRRLEVLEADPERGDYYPSWHVRETLMVVEACNNLALVDLTGEPEVDFVVPLGETIEGFGNFESSDGAIWYDGETLILAGRRYYSDYTLSVVAYDTTGPLYWGVYQCSIFDGNNPGASPYIQNGYDPVTIE